MQKKPGRTDLWWKNLFEGVALDSDWKKNFRVRKNDFFDLVEMIRPFASKRSTRARTDIVTLEKRVAITLYYLKDQGSFIMTANTFGVSTSTVSKSVKEITRIMSHFLAKEFMKYPSTMSEVETAKENFVKAFGFPHVIGCIDGTHIPIGQPSENAHDYYSYKMKYTINVQAICDHRGLFTDVDIKWPGSVHDARVFANSAVQKRYCDGSFKLYYKQLLPGDEFVPQVLLADPGYPLLPHVMREFATCHNNEEVIFNTMLRSVRNQIECAFGRLKARWRILLRPMDLKHEDIPDVVFTCFLLHNFCESRNIEPFLEGVNDIIISERVNASPADPIYSYFTKDGGQVRDAITRYFNEYL